jgi:hypothetical protein
MTQVSADDAKKKKVFFFAATVVAVVAVLFLYVYLNSSPTTPEAQAEPSVPIIVRTEIARSESSGDLKDVSKLKSVGRDKIIQRVEDRKLQETNDKLSRYNSDRLVAGARIVTPSEEGSVDKRIAEFIAAEKGKRVSDKVPSKEIDNPFGSVMGTGSSSTVSNNNNTQKPSGNVKAVKATKTKDKVAPQVGSSEAAANGFYFVTAEERKTGTNSDTAKVEKASGSPGGDSPKLHFYPGRIVGDHNVVTGDRVRIRNTEPMPFLGWVIPKNTVMDGVVTAGQNRLNIIVDGVYLEELRDNLPITVSVYDGSQEGIRVNSNPSKDQVIDATQMLGETAGNMIGGSVFGVGDVVRAAGQVTRSGQQRIALKDGRKINLIINETK